MQKRNKRPLWRVYAGILGGCRALCQSPRHFSKFLIGCLRAIQTRKRTTLPVREGCHVLSCDPIRQISIAICSFRHKELHATFKDVLGIFNFPILHIMDANRPFRRFQSDVIRMSSHKRHPTRNACFHVFFILGLITFILTSRKERAFKQDAIRPIGACVAVWQKIVGRCVPIRHKFS